jgi:hypothetical protein
MQIYEHKNHVNTAYSGCEHFSKMSLDMKLWLLPIQNLAREANRSTIELTE